MSSTTETGLGPWHVWRISHYFRFAICCTPRCASTSVVHWFNDLHPNPGESTFLSDGDWLTEGQRLKVIREYPTVVLARDPWSRLVSTYLGKIVTDQLLLNAATLIEAIQRILGQPVDIERGITFRQFIYATRLFTDDHWRPISEYVPFSPHWRTATRWNLVDVMAELTKTCGLPAVPLATDNVTRYHTWAEGAADMTPDRLRQYANEHGGYPRWDSFYDPELREEVGRRYQQDVIRFGLTWESALNPPTIPAIH